MIESFFKEMFSDIAYLNLLLIIIIFRIWGVGIIISMKQISGNLLETYNPIGKKFVDSNLKVQFARYFPLIVYNFTFFFMGDKYLIILFIMLFLYFVALLLSNIIGSSILNKIDELDYIKFCKHFGKFGIAFAIFQIIFLIFR